MDTKKYYFNRENRRLFNSYIKHRIRKRVKDGTVKKSQQALNHLDIFLGMISIKDLNEDYFDKFMDYLKNLKHNGKPVSPDTIINIISQLKLFFEYCGQQKGYKRAINRNFIELWRLSPSERQILKNRSVRSDVYLTIEDIFKIIELIPNDNILGIRLISLIIYCFLTGSRISAAITMSIGLVDLTKRIVYQDPNRGVMTKKSKYIVTTVPFFDTELYDQLVHWIDLLRSLGFTDADCLFPKAKSKKKDGYLEFDNATEFSKKNIALTTAEGLIKEACVNAGLKEAHAHSFRTSHINHVYRMTKSPMDRIAASRNVGHERISTTEINYLKLSQEEIHDRILKLKTKDEINGIPSELQEKFKEILKIMDEDLYNKYFSNKIDHTVDGENDE